MKGDKQFVEDVGLKDLPFPMRVASSVDPEGQRTVARISVHARIMREFEAGWIDRFIRILHRHRDSIGTASLRTNILDYLEELPANSVRVDFEYPFFLEKTTPVSREPCLVEYSCTSSARTQRSLPNAIVRFGIKVPAVTTYPGARAGRPGGLFGQLSVVTLEIESESDVYPEEAVALVDKHSLAPLYSFLTEADESFVIQAIHSKERTSVELVDRVNRELARDRRINWYSVRCSNYGMFHSYSTVVGTEKNRWIPHSSPEEQQL